MNKERLNCLQLFSILFFIMVAPLTGLSLIGIFKKANVDAYLCPLFASLLGIPLMLIFIFLSNYKPDLTLGEKIISIFGKVLGNIINYLLIVFILLFSVTLLFNLSDFIVSQFLPETPTYVVACLFASIIIYINTKGIETISRVSLVLFVIIFIFFMTTIFGLYPSLKIDNFKPFLEYGFKNPLSGSLYILFLNYFPIFTLLTVPKNQITDKKKYTKWFIGTYIFSSLFMFGIIFITLGNLGINLSQLYQYPEYIVLKRINLFEFLDRIENLLSIQRILKIYISLSFFTYFISNTIKPHNKSKIIPFFILIPMIIIPQIQYDNNTQFNNFILNYSPIYRIIFIVIILIVFIGALLKYIKKKNKY